MSRNFRNVNEVVIFRRQVPRVVYLLVPLALFAVVATGCGGTAAPAAPSNDVSQAARASSAGVIGPVQEGDGNSVTIDAVRTTVGSDMIDLDPDTAEIDTEPIEPGQEFLVLDVTITNTGTLPHEFNALSWSVADPDTGQTFQAALLGMTGRDLAAGDLEPAEWSSGELAIAIPTDATQLRVTYETQLFDQGTELTWDVTVPKARAEKSWSRGDEEV